MMLRQARQDRGWVARLTAKAETLARAAAENRLRAARSDPARVALELHFRGDDPATGVALTRAIEARVESLPREHEGFAIVTTTFLRARIERRTHNVRSALFEYRFRLLANPSE